MKVELMRGLGNFIGPPHFGSRILSTALMKDERLDVHFNIETVLNEVRGRSQLDSVDLGNIGNNRTALYKRWLDQLGSSFSLQKYTKIIPQSVKCDTILYSANNGMFDFPTISSLLNAGLKVVVGGPTVTIHKRNMRNVLASYGCKQLYNLTLVSGYVDLTTDLYSIIKNGRDFHIEDNDFSTFWDCENDFIDPYISVLMKLDHNNPGRYNLPVVFDSHCWWGKCTFCSYPHLNKSSFVLNTTPEKVANNIISSCEHYKTKKVHVHNDYFKFDSFNETVFEILNECGIKIKIYSGIHMLNNMKYVNKVNKYVRELFLGIESFDNFSLKYIRKGYTKIAIDKAFNNIMNTCNKKLDFNISLIMDLPVKYKSSVIENYKSLKELNRKLRNDKRFSVVLTPKLIEIGGHMRQTFIDNKHLKEANLSSEIVCGKYRFWKILDELNIQTPDIYKLRSTPLQRFDIDGNIVESDLDLLSEDLIKELL